MTVNPRQSFRLKLCFFVIMVSLGAFLTVTAVCGYFVQQEVREELETVANAKLDGVVTTLRSQLETTEVSAENFVSFNRSPRMSHRADSMHYFGKLFLEANPQIQGVVWAYIPDKGFPYSKKTSPYIMRDGKGGYICTDIVDSYDYEERNWYAYPVRTGKNVWSKPYRELNGTVITTYSGLLYNGEGHEFAVFALDISISSLVDSLQSMRPYKTAELAILDAEGRFVAHQDSDVVLNMDVTALAKRYKSKVDPKILEEMSNGVRGHGEITRDGETYYVFYAPVEKNGWTVVLEIPRIELRRNYDAMFRTLGLIMITVIIILAILTLVVIQRLTKPLEQFAKAARDISHGDFHIQLPVIKDHNELYDLRQALASMEVSLSNYMTQLKATTKANAKIENELYVASAIQQSMVPQKFPPFPDRPDIDVYASLIPAKAVGGDVYDFLLDGDDLYFCIGDVSGKGVPASLFMAIVSSLFRTVATTEKHPAKIAQRMNNTIAEHNEQNMFVTMYIGRANLVTGEVALCNCGHNAPVTNGCLDMTMGIVKPGDRHFMEMAPTNLPIGIIRGYDYKEIVFHVEPGVTLFLYTDGVTEAESKQKTLYGDDRLVEILRSCDKDATAEQLVKTVVEDVRAHSEKVDQSDDITILCIRLNGTPIETDYSVRRLIIKNNVEEMAQLEPFLESLCEAFDVEPSLIFQLNLALDEAMANAVKYAYPRGQEGPVTLAVRRDGDDLVFQLYDQGKPFDPTKGGEDVDTTLSAEERPIGGLGIFLIKQMMDSISYERKNDRNILTMIKKITK